MDFGLSTEWHAALQAIAIFAGVILIGLRAHYVLYKLAAGVESRRKSFSAATIVQRTYGPARWLLLLTAVELALPHLPLSAAALGTLKHLLEIAFIAVLAWLTFGAVEIFNALVNYRLPENIQDDV